MFSERTKDLAKQLMDIQKQLDESIKEDTDGRASMCTHTYVQLYFGCPEQPREVIDEILPKYEVQSGSKPDVEHLYFKIGEVPAVAVVGKIQ